METKFHSEEKAKKNKTKNPQNKQHKTNHTYKNAITTNKRKQQHKSVFKYIHSNKPQTAAGATNKTMQRGQHETSCPWNLSRNKKLFHLCSNRVGHTLTIKAGGGGTGAGRQNQRYHSHYYQHCMPPFCTWVGNNPCCRSPS